MHADEYRIYACLSDYEPHVPSWVEESRDDAESINTLIPHATGLAWPDAAVPPTTPTAVVYRTVTGATTSGRGRTVADPKRKLTPEEKAKVREDRSRQMQAMRRGEDWALGVRDRGPAKRLTRDYVDSHRRPMEFYMYALILLIIALFAEHSNKALSNYMQIFLLVVVVIIAVDGFFLRRTILKVVSERLPGESTRSLGLYAIMRALQLRRFRTPAPRLKPGDEY